jgi:hypothetical protein
MSDFIDHYLEYCRETEAHAVYHRWTAITSIAAVLGRNVFVPFGADRVFPNLYVMLVGVAGCRKSSAIKRMKRLVAESGYSKFAAKKTTKEKFLLDLEGVEDEWVPEHERRRNKSLLYDEVTSQNLWGSNSAGIAGISQEPKEVFICADEFNEFAGSGNLDFYSTLGDLWDWDDESPYTQRVKNSRSVSVYQPTISILGGNTPENFARAFPPEIIGQGFFSRLLLVHGVLSGRKYTIPPAPDPKLTEYIVGELRRISGIQRGATEITPCGYDLLDKIYQGWTDIPDVRFRSYSNRRSTQLLKLCLVVCAARAVHEITENIVLAANTFLASIEHTMPTALGEFGKARNSDISNMIMEKLSAAMKPMTTMELWSDVRMHLDKSMNLQEILQGLHFAGKIQQVPSVGWLPKKTMAREVKYVDYSFLTEEERQLI